MIILLWLSLVALAVIGLVAGYLQTRDDIADMKAGEERLRLREEREEACRYLIVTPTHRHYYTNAFTRIDCGITFADVHETKRVELHGTFTVTDRGPRPVDSPPATA